MGRPSTTRRAEPAAESNEEDPAEGGEGQATRWVILTNGHQWRLLDDPDVVTAVFG